MIKCQQFFTLLVLHFISEKATEDQLNKIVKIIKDYCGITELPDNVCNSKFPPPLKIRGLRGRIGKND